MSRLDPNGLRRLSRTPNGLRTPTACALNGLLHDQVYVWSFGFARTERLPFPVSPSLL